MGRRLAVLGVVAAALLALVAACTMPPTLKNGVYSLWATPPQAAVLDSHVATMPLPPAPEGPRVRAITDDPPEPNEPQVMDVDAEYFDRGRIDEASYRRLHFVEVRGTELLNGAPASPAIPASVDQVVRELAVLVEDENATNAFPAVATRTLNQPVDDLVHNGIELEDLDLPTATSTTTTLTTTPSASNTRRGTTTTTRTTPATRSRVTPTN